MQGTGQSNGEANGRPDTEVPGEPSAIGWPSTDDTAETSTNGTPTAAHLQSGSGWVESNTGTNGIVRVTDASDVPAPPRPDAATSAPPATPEGPPLPQWPTAESPQSSPAPVADPQAPTVPGVASGEQWQPPSAQGWPGSEAGQQWLGHLPESEAAAPEPQPQWPGQSEQQWPAQAQPEWPTPEPQQWPGQQPPVPWPDQQWQSPQVQGQQGWPAQQQWPGQDNQWPQQGGWPAQQQWPEPENQWPAQGQQPWPADQQPHQWPAQEQQQWPAQQPPAQQWPPPQPAQQWAPPEPHPPVSGRPTSGYPVSGQPVSGQPAFDQPIGEQPTSGQPISGQPVAGQPISGQPQFGYSGEPDPLTAPHWPIHQGDQTHQGAQTPPPPAAAPPGYPGGQAPGGQFPGTPPVPPPAPHDLQRPPDHYSYRPAPDAAAERRQPGPEPQPRPQPQPDWRGSTHQSFDQPAVPPTAEEFAARRAHRPRPPEPTMGVPALIRRVTFGTVSPALSKREIDFRDAVAKVRRNFGGLRQVTVVNPKGGAGKTVAVLMTAMTFGQNRGGYVLAWDNNETQGTLGMRSQQDYHVHTVRDVLRALPVFQNSGKVGELTPFVRSQGEAMFDVLASDESATAGEMLTAQAFVNIREVVSRFYKLIVVDTGNNVRAENWQAAIDATDQLVITMSARGDSAETAARMLDHLDQTGRHELVRRAVSVVAMPANRKDVDLAAIQRHFAARTRSVLLAPYERLLDSGEPIRYGELSSRTRNAWLRIAAAIAEGL